MRNFISIVLAESTSATTYTPAQTRMLKRKIAKLSVHGNTIPFVALGLHRTDERVYKELCKLMTSSPWSENTTITDTIPLDHLMVQNQDGVGADNLLTVLDHIQTAPLPELLKLTEDVYWVIEGHHRIALAILSGQTSIRATVEINQRIMTGAVAILQGS